MDRVGAAIYEPVVDFDLTAWRTTEPVPFADRLTGEELNLKPGDRWGKQLFDCAWFRFVASIPPDSPRPLTARIDINGELCLVDHVGVPLRGLTCVKSTFDPTLGTPGKTVYEVPDSLVTGDKVELWADAGFNDLFGMVVGDGTVEFAEVCFCREDVRGLYYDLQVLADLLDGVAETDPCHLRVIVAAHEVAGMLPVVDSASVARARGVLAPLFARGGNRPALEVSALGHSHLDLAWLWPIRETIRKGARTFATALYQIARQPDYVFGCSQPQLFVWMKAHYPVLYGKVRDAVLVGRIEPLGRFWVEPDCNIPCGESFVRQILQGARVFRDEFGMVPRFCWEPDVFGYHGQLPQILKKSGHDYFVTQKLSWNIVNRFPHHSFHWVGIDGTSILAHMLPEETYNSPAAPRSLRKIANEYAQKEVSSHALLVYGIGDGGGGPDGEHFERLRRESDLADLPKVVHRSAADFLTRWAQDADQFPTWRGELYLERHQGTFTTQACTKRNNRLCEIALREAEWAATVAEMSTAMPYPAAEFDAIWQEVLLYQFHDILPGSSIKRVYSECNARYTLLLERLEAIIGDRYRSVASTIDTDATHLVFNSLPWQRREWMKIAGEWTLADVPAMGYAALPRAGGALTVDASESRIENEGLRVEFNADGTISSIFDKVAKRETLAPGEPGNQFVVFADDGDAWDFPTDHKKKDVWVYLRQTPRALTLETARAYLDGPQAVMEQTYRFEDSRLTQRITLLDGGTQLEFETNVDWQQPGTMLRVRFPVSISSPDARFEIPFGSITRSCGETNLVEKAQLEVPAQQWVDLSQDDYGVALLNDCKYGFRVKGHTLDMNLLRSVPHPGKALIDKGDTSPTGGVYTDLGSHEFRYALLPHAGRIGEATLTEAARRFNVPLRIVERVRGTVGHLPGSASLLSGDNPAIEIAAVKRAEAGHGWVVRLVNVSVLPQSVRLQSILPWGTVTETDLMEDAITRPSIVHEDGALSLELAAYEIKTLRFTSTSSTD